MKFQYFPLIQIFILMPLFSMADDPLKEPAPPSPKKYILILQGREVLDKSLDSPDSFENRVEAIVGRNAEATFTEKAIALFPKSQTISATASSIISAEKTFPPMQLLIF